ncbi:MAG: chloride channel protein [Ignavibacterium album]|uniref:chloride channel protein n=1 Tax=Ignavibacterium album TaxID=591197 RepID=UPI0026E94CD3|nr:chloride channel protein [Ignavibacterium album]MCX8105343.1 chloride channel protein [Ignavibacterium album]
MDLMILSTDRAHYLRKWLLLANSEERPEKDFISTKNKDLLIEQIKKIFDRLRISLSPYSKLFRKTELTDYTVFSLFSVVIGLASGFSAVIFHNAIEFFNDVFFEQTKDGLFFLGSAAVILLPVIGMLIQSLMIHLFPEEAKKKGVYEIVKVVATKGGNIKFSTTLFHFFAPVISIGSGVTLGPEGPAAQLGGGVANKIANIVYLGDEKKRIFTAAGAGAAIAAIFNTPLAGVFFALEIILLSDFHTPTFSALIIASVSASTISRIFLGNESVFVFQILEPIKYSHLHIYAILGILTGFVSIVFIRWDDISKKMFSKIYNLNIPRIFVMSLVGVAIGVAGYYHKEIFGIGYKGINEILAENLSTQVVLVIFILKFILVPLAANSGAFGGLFAPALFLGASFGFVFHQILLRYFGIQTDLAAVILISMGSMLGGIHTIPITAIMIIFEMTQDYSFILPLMLAVISSTLLVQISIKGTIHKRKLEDEGFSFQQNDPYSSLNHTRVEELSLKNINIVNEDTDINSIITRFLETPENILYVVNDQKKLSGFIQEKEIRSILNDYESIKNVLVAKDISNPSLVVIDSNSTLSDALRIMMKHNLTEIPVVMRSDNSEQTMGVLTLTEIQSVLSRENFKNQFATSLASELKTLKQRQSIRVSDDHSIKEIKVPQNLIGKTLSEIKLRNKFGIEVLMIKKTDISIDGIQKQYLITAEPDYRFEIGDEIILFGKNENLRKFESENK